MNLAVRIVYIGEIVEHSKSKSAQPRYLTTRAHNLTTKETLSLPVWNRNSPSLFPLRLYRKPSRTKLETVEYLKSMQHAKIDDLDNDGGAAALAVQRRGSSSEFSRR